MDYYSTIEAIILTVENTLREEACYDALTEATGFSLSHLRELFSTHMEIPLARYIQWRKLSNAAYELAHTRAGVLDIALRYGFHSHETFTRAFRRMTGQSPAEFRKQDGQVVRRRLGSHAYGVMLTFDYDEMRERTMQKMEQYRDSDSTVLYGVPRIGHGEYGNTPYPVCLKACCDYLGQAVDYDYIIAASGMAFRLTWDTTSWYLGNVDICYTYDDYDTVYRKGIECLGREFLLLDRYKGASKGAFSAFIKEQVEKGNPVIATGIIGPPEACIVTGYRDHGDTLLGWNFFQENPTFGGGRELDESGYFISRNWWENEGTKSVIGLGEQAGKFYGLKEILANAIEVLTGRQWENYAKGLDAYDAWKKAILNDRDFPETLIMSALLERVICQNDAIRCLADGRSAAARFLRAAATTEPVHGGALTVIAAELERVAGAANRMAPLYQRDGEDKSGTLLAAGQTRKAIAALIDECKNHDGNALEEMKRLYEAL